MNSHMEHYFIAVPVGPFGLNANLLGLWIFKGFYETISMNRFRSRCSELHRKIETQKVWIQQPTMQCLLPPCCITHQPPRWGESCPTMAARQPPEHQLWLQYLGNYQCCQALCLPPCFCHKNPVGSPVQALQQLSQCLLLTECYA